MRTIWSSARLGSYTHTGVSWRQAGVGRRVEREARGHQFEERQAQGRARSRAMGQGSLPLLCCHPCTWMRVWGPKPMTPLASRYVPQAHTAPISVSTQVWLSPLDSCTARPASLGQATRPGV